MWRNPFYCGVSVCKLTDGEPIKGKWDAMVSIDTFKKVQEIINGKQKKSKPCKNHPQRPLTGLLVCGICGSRMTGYENKKKHLNYYKCQKCNGVSLNTETTPKALHIGAHDMFLSLLNGYEINSSLFEPFKEQFKRYYKYEKGEEQEKTNNVLKRLKEKEMELYMLKKNNALGKINEGEEFYMQLKAELEKEIVGLQMECNNVSDKISNLDYLIEKSLNLLENVSKYWVSTDTINKKELQHLLFPKGVTYNPQNREYLTPNVNEYFDLVSSFSANCKEIKKGTFSFSPENSLIVAGAGFEPTTFGL